MKKRQERAKYELSGRLFGSYRVLDSVFCVTILQKSCKKGWKVGSVVGTSCSYRGLEFDSQHPHVMSQLSVTPVLIGLMPLLT